MHRGYIKLWRKVSDSKMYRNRKLWSLWTWLLMNVTHKEIEIYTGLEKVKLYPGQIVCGRKQLARELLMSEQSVRTCLLNLKSTGNLTIKSTNKYSVITVVNWDTYQSDEEKPTIKSTSIQPATNQQLTTKQAHKNDKNIYTSVVEYLNKKTKKDFRSNSKATQKLIKARLNEGFKESDFYSVIDNQCLKWLTDPKMMEYLRPQTLFGTKFESYLNNCPNKQNPQNQKLENFKRIVSL